MTFSSAFGRTLSAAGNTDKTLCAITAAMKYGTGLQFFSHAHPAVYEWILEKKREGILEDLQHSKMRITEICNKYGFDSLSHFAHFCKDSFGDTPRALRKKAAGGEKIGKVQ